MPANIYPDMATAMGALSAAGVSHLVFHRGDASGDQSHVIPLLALYQRNHNYNARLPPGCVRAEIYGVIVIDALVPFPAGTLGLLPAGGYPTAPKGQRMANSYVDHFQVPGHLIAYVNLCPVGYSMANALAVAATGGMRKVNLTGAGGATQLSTALILHSKIYRQDIKAQFRGRKINGPLPVRPVLPNLPPAVQQDMDLDDFRQLRNIPLNTHTVVLWGRKSGKFGGLYPQMDSSATGMAQIAAACHARGYSVLLAGDITQQKVGLHAGFAHAIWLGDFWNQWAPIPNRRDLQIRFFYLLSKRLKETNHRLVHVGMRSGGLDMYMFSGQRVVYVVGPIRAGGGVNDNRMQPVVTAVQNARAALPARTGGSYYFDNFLATHVPKSYGIRVGGVPRPKGFAPPAPVAGALGDVDRLMAKIAAAL